MISFIDLDITPSTVDVKTISQTSVTSPHILAIAGRQKTKQNKNKTVTKVTKQNKTKQTTPNKTKTKSYYIRQYYLTIIYIRQYTLQFIDSNSCYLDLHC